MAPALPSVFRLLIVQSPSPEPPIIVKIIEPESTGLAEVVIGALGLSGALLLLAVVFAVVLAGILFYVRSRNPLSNASQGSQES
jgi:hypothetical protein